MSMARTGTRTPSSSIAVPLVIRGVSGIRWFIIFIFVYYGCHFRVCACGACGCAFREMNGEKCDVDGKERCGFVYVSE